MSKTDNHRLYGQYLHDRSLTPVVAIGSAGTGKTYGAVGAAVDWLEQSPARIFIGIRPNVAFADEIGFLPGTEDDKIGPWVRPMKQNFEKHGLGAAYLKLLEDKKRVQFHPLAFIQGLTFDNAFILIDEFQNMSLPQIKGVLTRVGQNSRVVMCGDIKQTSPLFKGSGVEKFLQLVEATGVRCHVVNFGPEDIVRSEQCKQWINAFEQFEEKSYELR